MCRATVSRLRWAVNGRLGDIVLFGAFLVRAVLSYVTSRKADRAAKLVYENAQSIARDAITVAVGFGGWLISAMWAHVQLIGVLIAYCLLLIAYCLLLIG